MSFMTPVSADGKHEVDEMNDLNPALVVENSKLFELVTSNRRPKMRKIKNMLSGSTIYPHSGVQINASREMN